MEKLIMYNNDNINALVKHLEENTISTNPQHLTEAQKAQVKENLGIESGGVDPTIIDSDGKKLSEIGDISVGWSDLLNNTIIFNDTVTATNDNLVVAYTSNISLSQKPSLGDYVKVTYGGIDYICLVRNEIWGGLWFGAPLTENDFDFSEFPFFVSIDGELLNQEESFIGFRTEGDKGVIKIELISYEHHKIPSQYLANIIKVRVHRGEDLPDGTKTYLCDWDAIELFNAIEEVRTRGDNTLFLCEHINNNDSYGFYYLPLIKIKDNKRIIFGGTTFYNTETDNYALDTIHIAIYGYGGQTYVEVKQLTFDPFNPPNS